jgi:hypothetical protein
LYKFLPKIAIVALGGKPLLGWRTGATAFAGEQLDERDVAWSAGKGELGSAGSNGNDEEEGDAGEHGSRRIGIGPYSKWRAGYRDPALQQWSR